MQTIKLNIWGNKDFASKVTVCIGVFFFLLAFLPSDISFKNINIVLGILIILKPRAIPDTTYINDELSNMTMWYCKADAEDNKTLNVGIFCFVMMLLSYFLWLYLITFDSSIYFHYLFYITIVVVIVSFMWLVLVTIYRNNGGCSI